jgi:hypothetical protein
MIKSGTHVVNFRILFSVPADKSFPLFLGDIGTLDHHVANDPFGAPPSRPPGLRLLILELISAWERPASVNAFRPSGPLPSKYSRINQRSQTAGENASGSFKLQGHYTPAPAAFLTCPPGLQ